MRSNEREEIRNMVTRNSLSYVWLINRLADRGIIVSKSQLSGILAGAIPGQKANEVIDESLEILNSYEQKMRT